MDQVVSEDQPLCARVQQGGWLGALRAGLRDGQEQRAQRRRVPPLPRARARKQRHAGPVELARPASALAGEARCDVLPDP